jgi:carbamoyl-phosphate synthase large subunit
LTDTITAQGKAVNVLLTSVGRRTYLVEYFRQALAGRGKVFAANTISEVPGMSVADKGFVVPPASDPGYAQAVLRICIDHNVRVVFSLHDWEAPFLAAAAERFRQRGIVLGVSDAEIIELCLDKCKTGGFAHDHGFAFPTTVTTLAAAREALSSGRLRFPLVMKPRRGQGSIGLDIVEEEWELELCHRRGLRNCLRMSSNGLLARDGDESLLIQEHVEGTEYGLDVVNDLAGRFACCFVKRKLGMRAGETDAAETVSSDLLEAFGRRLGESLHHIGMLDVDVILRRDTPYLLEMNPRFGGHYPFSHAAGANIPAALIAWVSGEPVRAEWLRVQPGIKYFKGLSLIKAPSGL